MTTLGSRDLDEGEPCSDDGSLSAASRPSGAYRVGLTQRAEFQRAAKGRRFSAKALSLQAFRRPEIETGEARFGLTVTKRVGNAVERNRIKRRLRAVLRSAGLAPTPNHDYVIVARREALGVPFAGLLADLTKTLAQARGGRSSGRREKSAGRPIKSEPSA